MKENLPQIAQYAEQYLQNSRLSIHSDGSVTLAGSEPVSSDSQTAGSSTVVAEPGTGDVGVIPPPPTAGGKHPTVAQCHPHLSPVISTGISMETGQKVIVFCSFLNIYID